MLKYAALFCWIALPIWSGGALLAQSDVEVIEGLIKSSGQFRYLQLDSAHAAASRAFHLADQAGYTLQRGKAAYQLGAILEDMGHPDSALYFAGLAEKDFGATGFGFGKVLALNAMGAEAGRKRIPEVPFNTFSAPMNMHWKFLIH